MFKTETLRPSQGHDYKRHNFSEYGALVIVVEEGERAILEQGYNGIQAAFQEANEVDRVRRRELRHLYLLTKREIPCIIVERDMENDRIVGQLIEALGKQSAIA